MGSPHEFNGKLCSFGGFMFGAWSFIGDNAVAIGAVMSVISVMVALFFYILDFRAKRRKERQELNLLTELVKHMNETKGLNTNDDKTQ